MDLMLHPQTPKVMEENELYNSSQEEMKLNTDNQTESKKDDETQPLTPSTEDKTVEKPVKKEKPIDEEKPAESTTAEQTTEAQEPKETVKAEEVKEADKPTETVKIEKKEETEKTEKPDEAKEVETTNEDEGSDLEEYSSLTREEIIATFRKLLKESPVVKIRNQVAQLRSNFEKTTKELENEERQKFIESGEPAELFVPQPDQLQKDFSALLLEYRTKREEERNKQESSREANLKAKYEVIENIKELINRQESLNETFQEFRSLQQKWHEIGQVPQNELHDLWENYHHHVENFYNYIKINNELRDLDLKKNLETKTELCEKAEALLLEPSVVKAFKTLQKYHDFWRETGPVPRDKKDELWERFKTATAKINQRQQEHFESLRHQLTHNLEAKTELCEKAEELLKVELKSPKEWEEKSKEIIDLQQVWKTIGFAPKKDNKAIYERFRTACDSFFNKKREFFKNYKTQQSENLQLKTELCIQAEAMMESTDWKKTTQLFIDIQKKWKEIGPVSRKQSDVVWKRFRTACDHFFDRKSHFFKHIDKEQEENLKLKEALIEEVNNYQLKEEGEDTISELQKFQKRWIEIGFVPIKEKDRVNQEFRNAINQKFDHLNLDKEDRSLHKYRNKLESWKLTQQFDEKIGSERHKLSNRLKQLESDIVVWENNIGFFAKSKKSEALMRDFKNKIKSGKSNIELLIKKLEIIEEMI